MSKILPIRSTRGKRFTQFQGNDVLVDEEFWNLDLFKEEPDDEEYKLEQEEEDIVDDDFDIPETFDEPEDTNETETRSKRKSVYVDPIAENLKNRRIARLTESPASSSTLRNTSQNPVRRSKRTSVTMHIVPKANISRAPTIHSQKQSTLQVCRLTQMELLEEAKTTELQNAQYLLDMQNSEVKIQPHLTSAACDVPMVSFYSKHCSNFIIFRGLQELPSFLTQPSSAQLL